MRSLFTFILSIVSFAFVFSQEQQGSAGAKGKIQAEVFTDYFYKINGEASPDSLYTGGEYQKTDNKRHGLAIRRFNLGYEYQFNDRFSARLLLEGNDGFTIENGTRGVYIKYAYLDWKLFGSNRLIIGAQSTPIFATFSEKYWGYRMVEKTIIDFRRDGSSNDLGIALTGNLNRSGTVGYYLMAGNGTSTKIENNNDKRIYGSVHGTLFDKKLAFQLYSDYEGAGDQVNRYLLKAFLAFDSKRLTVGVEPYNRLTTDSTNKVTRSTFGVSGFVHGNLIDNMLNGFFRIDLFDTNTKKDNFYNETFMVFGLDYTPVKNINIVPNLWINGYDAEDPLLPERKTDVVARLTVRFKI